MPPDRWLARLQAGWREARRVFRAVTVYAAAVRGDGETAMRWLREAVRLGYRDARGLAENPVFGSMGHEREFRRLVDDLEDRLAALWARIAGGGRS